MRTPRWFHAPATSRVGGDLFHVVETPAAEWMPFLDADLPFEHKAFAAHRALDEDPGCIEAHLFLTGHAKDGELARLHLAKAVTTGEALWAPVAATQADFSWWGVTATRPYMRAIKAVGDLLVEARDEVEAHRFYDALLRMNPGDNQGVRYVLAGLAEHEEAAAPRM